MRTEKTKRFKFILRNLLVLSIIGMIAGIIAGCPSRRMHIRRLSKFQDKMEETNPDTNLNGKVVLVMFWARNCGFSDKIINEIDEIGQKYKESGLETILICLDRDEAKPLIQTYVKEKGIQMPVLVDDVGISDDFRIKGTPAIFVFAANGRIAAKAMKTNDIQAIEKLIIKELAKIRPAKKKHASTNPKT